MAAEVRADPPFLAFSDPAMNEPRLQIEEQVRNIVGRHMEELRGCYRARLVTKPELQGKLILQFSIAPSGPIETPTFERSPLKDVQLEQCIINAIKSWSLAKPTNAIGIYPRVVVINPIQFMLEGGGVQAQSDGAVDAVSVPGNIDKKLIHGGVDRSLIPVIIKLHIDQVRTCYERELVSTPNLQGRVLVQFTIARTGRVVASAVQSSTMGNTRVENCIANAVQQWEFPKPQGGGTVLVTYPFVLRNAEDALKTDKQNAGLEQKPKHIEVEDSKSNP